MLSCSPWLCENRAIDANKKVNDEKGQLLVDTDGRIWFAHVHAANDSDGSAALGFSADILCQNEHLQKIYGDQAYNEAFARKMKEFGLAFEKRHDPNLPEALFLWPRDWLLREPSLGRTFFGESSKIMNSAHHLLSQEYF